MKKLIIFAAISSLLQWTLIALCVYFLVTPRNTTKKAFGYTYTTWITKDKKPEGWRWYR